MHPDNAPYVQFGDEGGAVKFTFNGDGTTSVKAWGVNAFDEETLGLIGNTLVAKHRMLQEQRQHEAYVTSALR